MTEYANLLIRELLVDGIRSNDVPSGCPALAGLDTNQIPFMKIKFRPSAGPTKIEGQQGDYPSRINVEASCLGMKNNRVCKICRIQIS